MDGKTYDRSEARRFAAIPGRLEHMGFYSFFAGEEVILGEYVLPVSVDCLLVPTKMASAHACW